MKHKCDKCEKNATYHCVEIVKGQKIEKHLCEAHAAEEGANEGKLGPNTPITELLTSFVKMHSSGAAPQDLVCEGCGMTFNQFREQSRLGCPQCYTAFEAALAPLLEKAHEGAVQHVGKAPRRCGSAEDRQKHLLRMRQRLDDAVASEDYELAAQLRDNIRQFEEEPK